MEAFIKVHGMSTFRSRSRQSPLSDQRESIRCADILSRYRSRQEVRGRPRFWEVVDGRLSLNLNAAAQAKWLEDIPGNIADAEANRAEIRSVAVDDL